MKYKKSNKSQRRSLQSRLQKEIQSVLKIRMKLRLISRNGKSSLIIFSKSSSKIGRSKRYLKKEGTCRKFVLLLSKTMITCNVITVNESLLL